MKNDIFQIMSPRLGNILLHYKISTIKELNKYKPFRKKLSKFRGIGEQLIAELCSLNDKMNRPLLLDKRELLVLKYRTSKYTLEETGKIIGVTRERIRQIEAKAIYKIEKVYKNNIKRK